MAHFAKLDLNNKVLRVNVVNNNELLLNGVENEQKGIDFLKSLHGQDTNWVQTSYNGNIRKNYAGIGYQYDQTRDAFIAPKPYDSWILNEINCRWEAPIDPPILSEEEKKTKMILWDEENLNWKIIQE
jgi:hypothetical protein